MSDPPVISNPALVTLLFSLFSFMVGSFASPFGEYCGIVCYMYWGILLLLKLLWIKLALRTRPSQRFISGFSD